MLDLVETRERENKWWASGIILCVCVCTRLCLHTFLCAYERLHVYLICFQEHLIRDFEMQVSTRRKVCLFGHRRMFSSMLPGTLNDFPPPFFSQWEILGGAKQLQTYKPKGPEIRQDVTSSWTLAIQRFTLFVSLLLPLSFGRKKKIPPANQLLQPRWIPHNCNHSW